jgi:hypothetical protein
MTAKRMTAKKMTAKKMTAKKVTGHKQHLCPTIKCVKQGSCRDCESKMTNGWILGLIFNELWCSD